MLIAHVDVVYKDNYIATCHYGLVSPVAYDRYCVGLYILLCRPIHVR